MLAGGGSWKWTLFVRVEMTPLELQSLVIELAPGRRPIESTPSSASAAAGAAVVELTVAGGATASVDAATGALLAVGSQKVVSSLEYYTPAPGTNHSHGWGNTEDCSTAYAFRPMPGVPAKPYTTRGGEPMPTVTKGVLVQQVHSGKPCGS